MDWNDLKYFLAIARLGSLTDSARHLQVSQATVARRIAALEASLGITLFTKKTDGYYVTENAKSLLEVAEHAEAYIRWIERGGENGSTSGLIRLAIPELLGNYFIIPYLAKLIQDHPGIKFEIVADVRSVRLSKGDADVVVRLLRPTHGAYTIKRLGNISLGLFASAEYVSKRGTLANKGPHLYIGWEKELGYLPLAKWLQSHTGTDPHVIQAHTMGSQLSACRAGIGIAMLPLFVGQGAGLVKVHDDVMSSDIWLLLRNGSHELLRVRVLAEFLEKIFAEAVDMLIGGGSPVPFLEPPSITRK